ncbi:MAG TPA: hypothetical protein VGO11_07765 [Chthoniobacteraceae bacterium]|jgi:hypothetical protein|nr:hypothetical protein [Chthoniobacteraceae bacterium]
MDVQERLRVFFDRLDQAPRCGSADEALALVCQAIEQVEDELCPVAREDPPPMRFTGRMYAPMADSVVRRPDGSLFASTRHHDIYCGANGAIIVEYMSASRRVFEKPAKP